MKSSRGRKEDGIYELCQVDQSIIERHVQRKLLMKYVAEKQFLLIYY